MLNFKKFCPSESWRMAVSDTYGTIIKHTIVELWDSESDAMAGIRISSFCGFKRYYLLWIDGSVHIHYSSGLVTKISRRIKELYMERGNK